MHGTRQFAKDLERFGGYEYTTSPLLSIRLANQRFNEMIASAVAYQGCSVVDVGCGDGTYTIELARRLQPCAMLGVDPLAESIQRANAVLDGAAPVRFEQGDAQRLAAEGRQFDIALYRGVLHHTADPHREIAMALRLARTIVAIEHNGMNPGMRLLHGLSQYHREHEERSYTPWRLRRWIREAGGVIDRFTYFNLVPFFAPDWFARAARVIEPFVESAPGLRHGLCGHCLLVFHRAP